MIIALRSTSTTNMPMKAMQTCGEHRSALVLDATCSAVPACYGGAMLCTGGDTVQNSKVSRVQEQLT